MDDVRIIKKYCDAEQGAPILTVMGAEKEEKEEKEGSLTQEAVAAGEKKPLKKILKVPASYCLLRNTRTVSLETHLLAL